MEKTLPVNARQLGLDGTVDSLRELLVQQFQVCSRPEEIQPDVPLFSAGVGLSSLEGMELLTTLEKNYGVQITDLEFWMDEPPTLAAVARFLVDNSPAG